MRIAALLALLLLLGTPVRAENLRALTLRQDILGWEGVGRIELGRDGYCTGALIAPDLVLTAAHCLFRGSAPRLREEIRFRAGDRNGDTIATRGVVQAAVPPAYLAAGSDAGARIAADIALLKLEAPIPAGTARPFLTEPPPQGGRVSVLSYGAGRDAVLSREAACRVLGRRDGILAFDCDVTFGSSGAPVFRIDGNRIRLVSIVSSGEGGDDGNLAFGPVLDGRLAPLQAVLGSGGGLWEDAAPAPRRLEAGAGRAMDGARFLRP